MMSDWKALKSGYDFCFAEKGKHIIYNLQNIIWRGYYSCPLISYKGGHLPPLPSQDRHPYLTHDYGLLNLLSMPNSAKLYLFFLHMFDLLSFTKILRVLQLLSYCCAPKQIAHLKCLCLIVLMDPLSLHPCKGVFPKDTVGGKQ